jgi:hypothetical protein
VALNSTSSDQVVISRPLRKLCWRESGYGLLSQPEGLEFSVSQGTSPVYRDVPAGDVFISTVGAVPAKNQAAL